MLHFLKYSINFMVFFFLNCLNRINKTTQFFKHSKHESNSFQSIFIKGNVTIISFSIFPVTFKHFHLLFSIYLIAYICSQKKILPRGLPSAFSSPHLLKSHPIHDLKHVLNRLYENPLLCSMQTEPLGIQEKAITFQLCCQREGRSSKALRSQSCKSIVLHVINKKIALSQLRVGSINIFLCNSHFQPLLLFFFLSKTQSLDEFLYR